MEIILNTKRFNSLIITKVLLMSKRTDITRRLFYKEKKGGRIQERKREKNKRKQLTDKHDETLFVRAEKKKKIKRRISKAGGITTREDFLAKTSIKVGRIEWIEREKINKLEKREERETLPRGDQASRRCL